MLPVANGEGRINAPQDVIEKLEEDGLIPLRYARESQPTGEYPANPNGAMHAIAALCDSTGNVLGMMPHPERYVRKTDHPNWRRRALKRQKPFGLVIFENVVAFARSA